MDKNSIINKGLWAASAISVILSVLTAVFGFTSERAFTKVILIFVSVLFLARAGMVAYLAYLDTFKVTSIVSKYNYFLNPQNRRKAISPDELTFEIVDSQMNAYVVDTFGSPLTLWQEQVFAEEGIFGAEDCFKVLLAYKMVHDLQTHHSKKVWNMFFDMSDVEFSDLAELLVRNGDEEFAKTLATFKERGVTSVSEASAFLDENESYIKSRMVNYVKRKIDLFYM